MKQLVVDKKTDSKKTNIHSAYFSGNILKF
jgi:hypothetical protein